MGAVRNAGYEVEINPKSRIPGLGCRPGHPDRSVVIEVSKEPKIVWQGGGMREIERARE